LSFYKMKENISKGNEVRKTIMVVDDHRYSLLALTRMIEQAGHDVISVENGHDAIKVFQGDKFPDLVFMDIKMPVLDGYFTMREIRKIKPDIKVIAETAYGLEGDKNLIMKAGFDGYLPKPITTQSLEEILKMFL
jgi:CheY-like chemotaxis protein